jgi:membrane protease YdiL (CAAX protease family)
LAYLLGFWIVTQILISIVVLVVALRQGGATGAQAFTKSLESDALDSSKPAVLTITLVSLVVLLPAIMVSVRLARLGPFGQLSSVRFRIRWGWMGKLLLPLLVFAIVTVGVQAFGIPGVPGFDQAYFVWRDGAFHANSAAVGHSTVSVGTAVLAIVLVIVLVPFQAAAEEYIFRGFIIQTVGAWIPWRKVGLVAGWFVSTIFFAWAHVPNGYNGWAILDVGSFGFVSALLLWRTGGLEAGILAHALNNIGIFVLQAPGWSAINPNDGNESPGQLIYTIVTLAIYAAAVDLMARWTKLDRRRPGGEVPRLVGPTPAWIGSEDAEAWVATPPAAGPVENVEGVGRRP